VELLEAHLIKIQKTQANGKSLDLMKHFKRSTARDFKIDYASLAQSLVDDAVQAIGSRRGAPR